MNEYREVIGLYEKKPALHCAVLDDGTAFNDHTLTEYEWIMIAELDAALRPCGPFISTMEATERVTMSLVIPMTLAILHATCRSTPIQVFEYSDGELSNVDFKSHDILSPEVQEVRKLLYDTNNKKFHVEERVGHREDLLICTILDPRFKLMNFPGCTVEMKSEAEHFLKCAYNSDWSPTAIAKGQEPEGNNSEEDEPTIVPEPPKPTSPPKRKLSVSPYVCLVYCTMTTINRLLYVCDIICR
jgi:hypothetical protein